MIKKIIFFLSLMKRKLKFKKNSYSFNGMDLIINYIFKDKSKGFYIDIGAQHPISNNNTYLLFKRNWSGINIDLDKKNIDLFNLARPNDINLNLALSNKVSIENLYYYHDGSPINTLSDKIYYSRIEPTKKIKSIKTDTLNNLLERLNFDKQIDYMNIDVEGYEEKVLEGFDIQKYKPSVISVEYLDLKLNKLEFQNNEIQNILSSNLYKFLTNNDYYFVNWLHADLVFVHKNLRN